MTSCAGLSWERGKTEGMEPGTEAVKPGGRFWCSAGCPRPGGTRPGHQGACGTGSCRSRAFHSRLSPSPALAAQPRQDARPAPRPALGALTVGMSPHPQGGAAGAGQPRGVGGVGVGGRVPAQLAARQRGAAGDHEMRGQVSGAAARRVDPGELQAVLVPVHHEGGGGSAQLSGHPPTAPTHAGDVNLGGRGAQRVPGPPLQPLP